MALFGFGKKKKEVEEEAPTTFEMPIEIMTTPTVPAPVAQEEEKKAEPVSIKYMQLTSFKEASRVADKLKSGCIVIADMSHLSGEELKIFRVYLAGVVYALDAKSEKTGESTLTIAPKDVDISSIASSNEDF